MSSPRPRDPRAPRISPGEIEQRISSILAEDCANLAEEIDQLNRAHSILHEALREA
ncbi:hypothetical protein CAPI_05870 [Corynebacterium capitovis DSM 44611]|uniref:hypothetical protein n=1 Tax=Corynebacterium capitovis TaxID=131081 RepID=UPI00037FEC1B|nr:hypothetical protein [Corynebacterium capitovis]WKD57722.1 hypothetical protein CAPI_05870 [Corynebacterium capitovis DSM 44611]